jgi:hypothetical protein
MQEPDCYKIRGMSVKEVDSMRGMMERKRWGLTLEEEFKIMGAFLGTPVGQKSALASLWRNHNLKFRRLCFYAEEMHHIRVKVLPPSDRQWTTMGHVLDLLEKPLQEMEPYESDWFREIVRNPELVWKTDTPFSRIKGAPDGSVQSPSR